MEVAGSTATPAGAMENAVVGAVDGGEAEPSSRIDIDLTPPANFVLDKIAICQLTTTFVKNILYMREQITETFDELNLRYGEPSSSSQPSDVLGSTGTQKGASANDAIISLTKVRKHKREGMKAVKFVAAINNALRAVHEVCLSPAITVHSVALSFGTTLTTSKESYCLNFECSNHINISNDNINPSAPRMRDQMNKILIRNIISVWSQNIRFPIKKKMKTNVFISMKINDTFLTANSPDIVTRYFTAKTNQQQPHTKMTKKRRMKACRQNRQLPRLIDTVDINLPDNSTINSTSGEMGSVSELGGWLVLRKGIRNLPTIK